MSLEEDLAARLRQLEDPYVDSQTRHAADEWLTQFRSSPQSWSAAQVGLSSPNPTLRVYAAQILAFKCKRQLSQLPSPDQQTLLLENAVTVMAAASDGATIRALSVAISNLIIQKADIPKPLEILGSRFAQDVMLEFLTVLPGECEDTYSALQASSETADIALHLKQRAQGWCAEVGAWLCSINEAALSSEDNLRQMGRQPATVEEAIHLSSAAVILQSSKIIQCFACWVHWGGLFHMRKPHMEHLLRLSGALMLLNPSTAPNAVAAGVEVILESIERSSEPSQSYLLEICLRLPGHIASLVQNRANIGELPHVYASYCATNAHTVASRLPHGAALRQGLMHLVALLGSSTNAGDEFLDEEDGDDSGVPVVDALGDVMEVVLDSTSSTNEDYSHTYDGNQQVPPMTDAEKVEFAGTVVALLMNQVLLPDSMFGSSTEMRAMPAMLRAMRAQSEWPLWLCGEVLTADGLAQQLAKFFESNSGAGGAGGQYGGGGSVQTLRALDVCFYALRSSSGAFTEHLPELGAPPPSWLSILLSLYAAAQQAQQHLTHIAPASIMFYYDSLSSFTAIAPALLKVLATAPQLQESAAGLLQLILNQAATAVNSTTSSAALLGGDESLIEAAGDAVRAMMSSPTEIQNLATAAGVCSAIDAMLVSLLQHPRLYQDPSARKACHHLITAAVHALHAADLTAAEAACATLRSRVLQLMINAARASRTNQSVLLQLHAVLEDTLAMLNALESYADMGLQINHVAKACATETVAACLAAWPDIMEAVRLVATTFTSSSSRTPSIDASVLYQDSSQCMCSCIQLSPDLIQSSLQPLLDSLLNTFFLPGGHAVHRVLCNALEALGNTPASTTLLISAVGALLTAPQAQQFYAIRGGDADPDTASALLTIATAVLRQWSSSASQIAAPEALLECVRISLHLAAANAACNHKDTCQRAVSTLAAALAFILDTASPLHPALLDVARAEGASVMQGVLLCLLSLYSSSFLPKLVTLMTDAAMIAAGCCDVKPGADVATVSAAASAVLQGWWAAARQKLEASGAVPAAASDALLTAWNWSPMVEAAAAARVGTGSLSSDGRGAAEVRRGVQRAVRQLADQIRRSNAVGL